VQFAGKAERRVWVYIYSEKIIGEECIMYLRDRNSGDLVEVLDIAAMVDPCAAQLEGRFHAGEELQEPATFSKDELEFPSGEALPRCWKDATYRTTSR
jgi:hypothetical protein